MKVVQESENSAASRVNGKQARTNEDVSRDRLFLKKRNYFFFSERSKLSWNADEVGFARAFPKARKKIDEYLADHPVDFGWQKDKNLMVRSRTDRRKYQP
ncbi:MAG: hypothetical protein WKF87_04405 [Chryseolinea sp.]